MMTACGAAPHAGADALEIDRPFVLGVGQQARWAAGDLTVHFERVLVDSRCPRGERCVVAGVARIRVRVDAAGKAGHPLELQLPDSPTAALPGNTVDLTLLRLDPYPISGRTAMSEPAMATLVLRRASPTDR